MAKTASNSKTDGNSTIDVEAAEHKLEEFAEDLGKMLGQARGKAENWLGQRQAIVKHLEELRDTASGLLSRFSSHAEPAAPARSEAPAKRGPGRPAAAAPVAEAPPARDAGQSNKTSGQRSPMSDEARAKISAAQKKRWAKQRRG